MKRRKARAPQIVRFRDSRDVHEQFKGILEYEGTRGPVKEICVVCRKEEVYEGNKCRGCYERAD